MLFYFNHAFPQTDFKFSEINKTTSYFHTLNKSYTRTAESFKGLAIDQISSAWAYLDFDKDGDQDFIFASPCYDKSCGNTRKKVYILKNDNGKFILWKSLDGFKWPRKGGLADFDNNGYMDFWVADQGPDYEPYPGSELGIVYFYKDSAVSKLIPNSVAFNHTAATGDIDGDSDIDIFTVSYKYLNDGSGNFTKSKSLYASISDVTSEVGSGYFHHELMDLNNDGYLDAIFGHAEIFGDSTWDSSPRQFNGRNRIFWGNGKGDFYYSNSTQLPMTYPETKDTFSIVDDFDFYDFNNDGFQDIIVLRSCWRGVGYYIQILENKKNKEFIEVTDKYINNFKYNREGSPGSFNWLVWIRLVDLNKDNLPDFIVREPSAPKTVPNNEREWYWINKNGVFLQDTVYIPCGIIEKPTLEKLKYNLYTKDSIEIKIKNSVTNSIYNWEVNGELDKNLNSKSKFFKDTATIRVLMTDSMGCTVYSDPVKLMTKGLPMNSSYYKNNNTWRSGYQEVHQKIDIDNDGTEDYFFLKLTKNRTGKQVLYGVGSNTLYSNGLNVGSDPPDSIFKNFSKMVSSKIYDSLYYSIPFIYNSKTSELLRPNQFISNFNKNIDTLLSYNFDVLVTTNINKDAYPDFVALSNNDFLVNQVILFVSTGKFKYEVKYLPIGWKTADARLRYSMATGDINHDGLSDIVLTSYTDKNVFDIFYGKDTLGNFQTNSIIEFTSVNDIVSKPIHFEIDDFNNDGYDDIIVPESSYSANGNTTYLPTRIFLNQNGKLGSPISLNISAKFQGTSKVGSSILSDDINGDGLNDIIIGLHDDYEIIQPTADRNYLFQYFENDGKNNFINKTDSKFENEGEVKSINRAEGIAELEARVQYDLDNDGKKEILLSNYVPPSFVPNAFGWTGFPKKYYYFKKNSSDIYSLQSFSDTIKFKDTKLDSIFIISNCQFDYGDNAKGTRVNVTPTKTTSLTQNNLPLYMICERDSLGMKFNLADRYIGKFLMDSTSRKASGKISNTINAFTNNKYTPYVIDSFYCVLDIGPEVYVKIQPSPALPKVTDTAFCQNANTDTLKAIGLSETTILWYGTNATGGVATTNSPKPSSSIAGTVSYYVTQKLNSTGCESERAKIVITTKGLPNSPLISRDADNNLITNINGVTWYKDGVKIADTTQKIKPTSNGNYTATTTQNGCTSPASANYYYLTSAVANLSGDEFFKVSPNPTNGEIYLNYNIRSTKDVYINVIDMSGRTIISNRKVNSGSKLNLGTTMKGNYIIQVKDKAGRLLTTEKLVKN